MCQSVAKPSSALYSHIGEMPIRLRRVCRASSGDQTGESLWSLLAKIRRSERNNVCVRNCVLVYPLISYRMYAGTDAQRTFDSSIVCILVFGDIAMTINQRFRLGFFSYLQSEKPIAEIYAENLELYQAADELGFDTAWVAQQHFGYIGGLPSPFIFFSALAERTKQIGFGTAVVSLPLEDPLRIAEDAAAFECSTRVACSWVSAPESPATPFLRPSESQEATSAGCTTARSTGQLMCWHARN